MKKSDIQKNKSDSKVVRKTIMIFVMIIIIILLITSCTSGLWGKIGNTFFGNSSYIIQDDGIKEEVKNTKLQFIKETGNTTLGETYRMEFQTTEINPEEFTCITSDANIATCVVQGDYVEVYTKNTGTITVTVIAETNGKKYVGTHELTIQEQTGKINLESNDGTLNLANTKTKKIRYSLENIKGDIKIIVSNEKIATATIKNNVIYITAHKTGTVKITLLVTYNGKEYKNSYNLTIIDKEKEEVVIKSNDNYLSSIKTNQGELDPSFVKDTNKYNIVVKDNIDKISLDIIKTDEKANAYYYLNDKKIESLKDIPLNYGINIIKIGVIAEDGSTRIYYLTITKTKPVIDPTANSNKLSSLEANEGTIKPSFNKETNNYSIEVPYEQERITITSVLESKNAIVSYKYNAEKAGDLNNLPLKEGNNKVEIIVKGKDGTTNTYVINIHRAYRVLSSTNTLDNIIISKGELNPSFDKNTTSYSVSINTEIEYIDIEAIKTDDKSSIKYQVNGKTVTSLSNVRLNKGDNIITITVTSENGETKKYSITINRAKSNIATLDELSSSAGNLSPEFSKNKNDYTLNLTYHTNKISLTIKKTSEYSSIKYYLNNNLIESLKNISVTEGTINKLEIKVTAEDGTTNIYKVIIKRALDDRNTLNNLSISGFELNEIFNSNINNYSSKVLFNTETIKLNATALSNKATIKYFNVDSQNRTEINNESISIKEGTNKIEIEVTSQSGSKNSYFIEIYRPSRKIAFVEESLIIYRENGTLDIPFEIYEDDLLLSKEQYNIKDIKVTSPSFNGKIEIKDEVISITPSNEDIDKESILTINYNNTTDTIRIKVLMNQYYIEINSSNYNMDYISSEDSTRDIIFNTNIFNKDITISNTEKGIKLSNDKGHIVIESEDEKVLSILYNEDSNLIATNYIEFISKAHKEGIVKITITGEVYGKKLDPKEITMIITTKYLLIIDANEGFFNTFTNKYSFKFDKNQILDLSEFVPYKEAEGNCQYFVLDKYNTEKDGNGTDYGKDQIITINNDLTIYAIYKDTAERIELTENNILYLTDVDLFHNDEYYKKYNIDKIIYPGASGSHVMTITNSTNNPIKITKINIEENTLCLNNPSGCINIGYIVKSTFKDMDTYKYHYGQENKFVILNKDNDIVSSNIENKYHNEKTIILDEPIEVLPGEANELYISLLWEWVEENNTLDTAIGSIKNDVDYSITVSIEYEKTNNHCIINQ